jgi:hypothetical protein
MHCKNVHCLKKTNHNLTANILIISYSKEKKVNLFGHWKRSQELSAILEETVEDN